MGKKNYLLRVKKEHILVFLVLFALACARVCVFAPRRSRVQVKSQLILWERERNRISAQRAVLFSFHEVSALSCSRFFFSSIFVFVQFTPFFRPFTLLPFFLQL